MKDALLNWLEERSGIPALFQQVRSWSVPAGRGLFHYFPAMILFGFLLQAITGILLWVHYSPSAQSAWESIFYMQYKLPGGWLIRGIHHYSAQLLVALAGLYVLGLIYKGRYRPPREFVFWSAVGLMLFTLASCLTGDLLTWTLAGMSATLVRVRFLLMLPWIGEPLFKIIAGGPDFGTLTIPRFLVLHVLVFGGGFFVLALLWRYFDHRAATVAVPEATPKKEDDEDEKETKRSCPTVWTPFWSNEFLKCSLACLVFMLATLLLVFHKPVVDFIRPGLVDIHPHISESSLGAHLGAPADPADFYAAARPEWSFRALYHFSNVKRPATVMEERIDENGAKTEVPTKKDIDVFPGDKKYLPIFVIPGLLFLYVMLIPIIGRSRPGHYFNVLAVSVLFLGFCYLTYISYHHDYIDQSQNAKDFRVDEAKSRLKADRAIELCLAPEGIPPEGAVALLERDPFLQGPALYEQHCATCHPFHPMNGEAEHPDFRPIPCDTPSAPNLYHPIRKQWISGFLDAKRIRSDDYFGQTKFVGGSMARFVRNELKDMLAEEDEDFDYEKMLDQLIDVLVDDAKRDHPRTETPQGVEGLTREQTNLFGEFTCNDCHYVYGQQGKPKIQAPDLRGYMSREWMIGIVADPSSTRFYGPDVAKDKGNDRMPSFYLGPHDATMTLQEIESLVDWLRGKWYRHIQTSPNKRTTDETPGPASGEGEETKPVGDGNALPRLEPAS